MAIVLGGNSPPFKGGARNLSDLSLEFVEEGLWQNRFVIPASARGSQATTKIGALRMSPPAMAGVTVIKLRCAQFALTVF